MENLKNIRHKKAKSRALSIPVRVLRGILKTFFSIFILLVQLAWVFFAVYYYRNIPYLALISNIIAVVVVLVVCYTKQNSEYKLLWIIVIMLIPLAGTVWYGLYGYGRSTPKRAQKEAERAFSFNIPRNDVINDMPDGVDKKLCTMLSNLSHMPAYADQDIMYYTDGLELYENMMDCIAKAEKYVFIESFIFSEGRLLSELESLVVRKADEGVVVKILFDSIGSYNRLKRKTVERLNSHPNIQVRAFNRIGITVRPSLNYRDHRKIVLVDGRFAFIGGTNFADEYVHYIKRFGFWRDGGARFSGEVVYPFAYLFCESWYMATRVKLDIGDLKADINSKTENLAFSDKNYVIAFGDTPTDSLDPAYNICMSLFENASKSIFISTPYLILDHEMTAVLCRAAQSGVRVVVLTPGIPDKKIVYAVTRSNYDSLIKHGVEVYEYTPGFNHCKSIIVDDRYALIGSINLDYRSLLLHYEVGTLIIGSKSVVKIKKDFLDALAQSKRITRESYINRPLAYKLLQFLLNTIAPLL